MSANLDNAILVSTYNAYKNDSFVHKGTITFPTSLTAGAYGIVTVPISLSISPQFSEFSAYFTETLDLTSYANGVYGNPQWYPAVLAASGGVGVWVTAPSGNQGVLTANILPIIDGNSITVQAIVNNPYSNSITLAPLSVPFAFTQYSLAN